MKKIIIAGIIVGTLLFIWSLSADAAQQSDYWIVERGDTLTGISKQVYGTIDKWTIIRDLNDLKKPYVIRPKQKLRVIDLAPEEKKALAFEIAWDYMCKYFKNRRGRIYDTNLTREDAYREARSTFLANETTYEIGHSLNRTVAMLEWVDMVEIADSLRENVGIHWHVLVMAALGAQESGFRNVPGSHSELGPYQIKPQTALWLLSDEAPIRNESEASSLLDIPFNNTWMSYQILQKRGLTTDMNSLIPALENYNAGSDKREYAKQVKKRFDGLMLRYQEKVVESVR